MKNQLAIIVLATSVVACGDDLSSSADNAKNKVENATTNVDPGALKDDVESAVVDRLDCSGYVREETRNSIAASLEGQDFDGLLAEPTELARAVGAAALTTDTTVLLVGNISRLASQGHLQTAMTGQWDDLSCDTAPTVDPCSDLLNGVTAGEVTTSVVCESGQIASVRAEFSDGCQLFGTENGGAVNYERGGTLDFDNMTLGTVNEVSGRMAVELTDGEIRRMLLDTADPVEIASNVGKSCEERLIMRAFDAIDSAESYSIDMDIERIVGDDVLRVRTVDGAAAWGKPVDCTCPVTGSALELTMTDPVGLGQEGTVQFAYGAAQGDVCGSSEASIMTWPEGCSGDESCGREIAESVLGALVTTSCVGR